MILDGKIEKHRVQSWIVNAMKSDGSQHSGESRMSMPMASVWNKLIFKVPANSSHSVILQFFILKLSLDLLVL